VAATPVSALVADAEIAKAVIDAAIVADMGPPIAAVEAVAVVVVAPIAGGPESTLVGSLNPTAGHPVVIALTPGPVAGRPEIAVAGGGRLLIVGQGRWRLIGVLNWLSAVAWIVRTLVIPLIGCLIRSLTVGAARVRSTIRRGGRSA
jgi:hypothetical protein